MRLHGGCSKKDVPVPDDSSEESEGEGALLQSEPNPPAAAARKADKKAAEEAEGQAASSEPGPWARGYVFPQAERG